MRLLKESYGVGHHEYATAMNNVATLYQASDESGATAHRTTTATVHMSATDGPILAMRYRRSAVTRRLSPCMNLRRFVYLSFVIRPNIGQTTTD